MTITAFVDEARAARAAGRDWAETPLRERLKPVRRLRDLLVDAADELTAAVEADVARPPAEVLGSDVLPLAAAARFLERSAGRVLAPRPTARPPLWLLGQSDVVHRRPWGVVGIIGTWNYPLYLNGVQLLHALTAGNAVLWKPSELGSRSAAVLHRLLLAAGFPRDLVQLLPADRDAGPRLVESDIQHLVFTGSSAVGRKIAVRLAERLIPSTLELSGVDAMFVLDDADVPLAARAAAFGVTLNRGQTCLAVRRIFVHRSALDAFVAELKPRLEAAGLLSVVTPGQAAHARELIDDAERLGGTPIAAGRFDGHALTPHVFLPGTPAMRVCTEESFAPLAAVIPVGSTDEAVALDASCPYALGASVFTRDRVRAGLLAERLRVGHVCVNDVIAPTAHPSTPFGGTGASGWGTTQGVEGLLAMTVPQTVCRRAGRWRPHYDGVTPQLESQLRRVLAGTHRQGWLARLRGWVTGN
jgi:acyl-CoA reductase-like NAD-dependent aldehyde dehydrogenase